MREKAKQKTRKELATIWRYGLGSTISYLINLLIIWIMTDMLGVHYLLSSIVGYASIVISSYIFSVTWIFTERKIASKGKEFVAFTLITVFAILMNLLSMWFFTDYLGWYYIISNITTNFLATIWGYVPKKIFLFSSKKEKVEFEVEDVLPSLDDPDDLPTPFIFEDEIEQD
jgi:putative flippase GtrA